MLGSHVCRQCRTRLNPQRASSRITQWQSRATFISLRNKQPQNGPDQVEATPHTEKTQTSPQADQRPSYDLFDRAKIGPEARQPGRVGRYSRHMRETDVAPEAMEDAPGTPAAALEEGKLDTEDEGKTYAPLILRALRDKGVRAGWPLFDKIYTSADCEALTKPSTLDIHIINEKRFFPEVLARVLKEFCEGQGEPVVTPTTALLRYEQLGVAPPGLWVKNVIEPLTYQVMLATNGVSKKPQRDLPSLLSELVSVWRLFFQCKGAGNKPLDAVDPEWNLPAVDAIPHVFPTVDFNVRLQGFHPRCVGSPALGFCAIYFFNLSDAINSIESLKLEAAPFQDLLVRVLAGSRVNAVLKHPAFSRAFQALPQEIQVEITREVESAVPKAEAAIGLQSVASKKTSGSSGNKSAEPATTDLESFNLKVINRAIEARSSPMILEKHWKRIIRDYTQSGKTAIPPSIYNAFLSGYLILRQAPRSVEVWNHMISSGVRPELPTWVAMLEGCEKAKDLEGFNAMWQRMQSMGFEPDNYAWTTRVHGLMSFRQIDAGLRTLDDMGKRWRAAETAKNAPVSNPRSSKGSKNSPNPAKGVNNCTKPTVEVINGAMSGIVALPQSARISHSKRISYVQKILQWGLQFDVKPDTRTYNILVQLYLNAGDYATASNILQQMETNGVGADVSTHTMLIVAALENGSLDSLSEPDRASRLIQMFESLEAGGLRPNNYTYAAAIDGLLKQYGSHSAAHALVDHMRSRNLSPSVHIYTSLTTHYFQQSPPAITAVDSLLTHIFDSPHTDSDKTFFDRVLEGYAAHAEVGRMMSVLTRMSKRGHHPSFRALTAVIQALVNAGDVDRARFIVHDVKRGEGIAMGGVTGAFNDESHFLHVAERLGLVGEGEERMGDAFKIRKDMRVLDERIEGAIRREQGEGGETLTPQQEGQQEDGVSEHNADREKSAQGLDDDIHGFLAGEGEGAKAGSR